MTDKTETLRNLLGHVETAKGFLGTLDQFVDVVIVKVDAFLDAMVEEAETRIEVEEAKAAKTEGKNEEEVKRLLKDIFGDDFGLGKFPPFTWGDSTDKP